MRNAIEKTTFSAATLLALCGTTVTLADQVILDDLIVDGSACIGFDCVDGESFGFDTLRIKENNLRIKAIDTSSTASFASNDWQITFNDSANGGANKFSIDDIDAGRTPFTIEAGAPSNSLYVDDAGRIGLGTNTPVVEAHIKDGDTPTLRLEQDGTSGFTPQTWDVAGNETNFFIRDVTSGSRLPFKIRAGAPTDSIRIEPDGDVGFGTSLVQASVHIRRTSGAPSLILESTAATPDVKWEIKANQDTGRMTFKDLNGSTTPFKFQPDAAENLLRVGVLDPLAVSVRGMLVIENTDGATQWDFKVNDSTGRLTMKDRNGSTTPIKIAPNAVENLLRVGIAATNTVSIGGDLVIAGNCSEADGACADYVFEPDYELRSLDALAEFIADNRHLPNVPSADKMEANGVNMAHFSGRLLEKIEELTLYTLQQQETIEQQQATVDALNTRLARMERANR